MLSLGHVEPYSFRQSHPAAGRMPMSVAAGLKFDRGVLLCADSQLSYGGVAKTKGQKLGAFHLSPAVKIGMAFAGSVSQAKVGMRDVLEAARDCGSEAAADIL